MSYDKHRCARLRLASLKLRAAGALEAIADAMRGGPTLAKALGDFELHVEACGSCRQTTAINWRLCAHGARLYTALCDARRSSDGRTVRT